MKQEEIDKYNKELETKSPQEIIRWAVKKFGDKLVLSSSLGVEDQVLTDMLMRISSSTDIFTLDTGRLFPETFNLIDKTNTRYKTKVKVYFPDYKAVELMVGEHGVNLFYDSIEKRKMCCHIRKIEPLKRAFVGRTAWICGLRREQSVTRQNVNLIEWDKANQLIKINPIIDWTEKQVWEYITLNLVPYHELHDKGFPSIGCQPCTRAVEKGEDVRAGRWWWESPEHKECGLHVQEDLKVETVIKTNSLSNLK